MSESALLELRGVSKEFTVETSSLKLLTSRARRIRAVHGLSLSVQRGEVIGLVGESGCGKSTSALLILRLLQVSAGTIHYRGEDVTSLAGAALMPFRRRVQMVFQDSHSALNPRKIVRRTLLEALRVRHGKIADLEDKAVELLAATGLGAEVLRRYPHELSGGQRQRIGIARAMAMEPEFIVADEPVSSLDVSLQAQIINVFRALCEQRGLTMMLISHDLALVNYLCSRVLVMYAGQVVESGTPEDVMRNAVHPYTRALIGAVPRGLQGRGRRRKVLAGSVEALGNGCPFAPRCSDATDTCHRLMPEVTTVEEGHTAACHLLDRGG